MASSATAVPIDYNSEESKRIVDEIKLSLLHSSPKKSKKRLNSTSPYDFPKNAGSNHDKKSKKKVIVESKPRKLNGKSATIDEVDIILSYYTKSFRDDNQVSFSTSLHIPALTHTLTNRQRMKLYMLRSSLSRCLTWTA